jgi:hypothetical protein
MHHADHVAPLYPQKLTITPPTSGGRSAGIVRSRTQTVEPPPKPQVGGGRHLLVGSLRKSRCLPDPSTEDRNRSGLTMCSRCCIVNFSVIFTNYLHSIRWILFLLSFFSKGPCWHNCARRYAGFAVRRPGQLDDSCKSLTIIITLFACLLCARCIFMMVACNFETLRTECSVPAIHQKYGSPKGTLFSIYDLCNDSVSPCCTAPGSTSSG